MLGWFTVWEVSQHAMNLLRQPCREELSPPVNSQLHSACNLMRDTDWAELPSQPAQEFLTQRKHKLLSDYCCF